ncbi:TPA: class C sortase [Streptococcus pyogenes]|uniref:class C sortase n=1 Tax=Streptococcus pyogenes TaxID=1314 RepID=UPI000386C65C|nr:class C sortase [Streptococcus pyogenes]EPZ45824.1 sortase [Streptococcus pyogenes GA40634]HER4522388.1 class C sortase [Streptococcus pyogenes NGAS760]HER4525974.1 class C sortase [Streptococcus pyogenes NGAS758]HER4529954.1 class C sortase [Streptococcus pyogenes NGAS746]HER4530776.1 class C sortase [Streptococcus pyogenes NGAS759]HER4534676.1 class C sortase [Streptococcus pyogenes NGAS737]HER4544256.1 class C sortase [Streptococcus pyogenes NGAS675]HER4547678.1 class C sortase [Strep
MSKQKCVGYVLMILGLGLPLFFLTLMSLNQFQEQVAYQKFQTENRSWKNSQKEWVNRHNQEQALADRATTDPFVDAQNQLKQSPFDDNIIGYIIIPKLRMAQPIRVGASERHLEKGVAQVTGTSLPIGGLGTRSVIAGHRSWYDNERFLRIAELSLGDQIVIDLGVYQLEYRVKSVEIIDAKDWRQLTAKKSQDLITLLTCNPLYPPFNERLLVNAERVLPSLSDLPTKTRNKMDQSQLESPLASHKTSLVKLPLVLPFGIWVCLGWLIESYFIYRLFRQCKGDS